MKQYAVGLMSGTSMDGIDAALLLLNDDEYDVREICDTSLSYAFETKVLLKALELSVRAAAGDLVVAAAHFDDQLNYYATQQLSLPYARVLSQIQTFLHLTHTPTFQDALYHSTQLHIECVQQLLKKCDMLAADISVIGYHGQTVYHQPSQKITLSLGDPQLMADRLNIPVVHDFRRQDVAAGGQGAPFAPLYHFALVMRDQKYPLGIINCGGIANITIIPDSDPQHIIACDTGPGNGLIDLFIRQKTHGREFMDADGRYGLIGQVDQAILDVLFQRSIQIDGVNFFDMPAPKSLDIGDMQLIAQLNAIEFHDACATLEAFTALSIVRTIVDVCPADKIPHRWVVSGGGWKNPVIRQQFSSELARVLGDDIILYTADDFGWNATSLEAQIFAYLAVRSLHDKPLSLPNTTGVPNAMCGGTCYLPKMGI